MTIAGCAHGRPFGLCLVCAETYPATMTLAGAHPERYTKALAVVDAARKQHHSNPKYPQMCICGLVAREPVFIPQCPILAALAAFDEVQP